jgi:hypothetical protein
MHVQVGLHQPVVSKDRFHPACNDFLQETCASYGIHPSKYKQGKKVKLFFK